MKNVYKIYHTYSSTYDGIYVESDMDINEVADIVIGLQFYIEDFTKHGAHACITEEMAVYLLCEFFNCERYNTGNLYLHKFYDTDTDDLAEILWIDLYSDREHRCGKDYKKYIDRIKPYVRSEYITKLCSFFNDGDIFKKSKYSMLTPQEIIKKY